MSKENRLSDERLAVLVTLLEQRDTKPPFHEIASILAELRSLRSGPIAGVAVKSLNWILVKPDYWQAVTPFGTFSVVAQPCFGKPWRTFSPTDWEGFIGDGAEELKEKIEISYSKRILSALAYSEQEPAAWRCEDLILPAVSIIEDRRHAESRMRQTEAWRVTPLYPARQPDLANSDNLVERVFHAAVPFVAGTAFRELRAALTAAMKQS